MISFAILNDEVRLKSRKSGLEPLESGEVGGFPSCDQPGLPHLPTTGHLLPDTPLFITLGGEISLLHSHVSCKTTRSSTFTKFTCDQHSCQLCIFHWFINIILLSKSFTNVNAHWFSSHICVAQKDRFEYREGRWPHIDKCFLQFSHVFAPQNVFSPQNVFAPPPNTFSLDRWRYHWRVKTTLSYACTLSVNVFSCPEQLNTAIWEKFSNYPIKKCTLINISTSHSKQPQGAMLEACDLWDTDYNSDNWEPKLMTLDSICNSCDVW